jgi:crotonobetainyl-CoA:carnitine CoA-transferase CaiB-like acyl-CoA transferase
MILAIGNDGQFERFCQAAGHPEWALDLRFATNPQRVHHRATLIPLLRQATVMRSTAEWIELLESRAVPCGPIHRIDEVFGNPQVIARGLKLDLPHLTAGTLSTVASPLRLSASPVVALRAPPLLGQHSDEVFRDWLRR